MYGADVAQLRALAGKFEQLADQLDSGRVTVGNAIRISAWVGPFATSFRYQWDSGYSVQVHNAAMLLRTNAGKVRANADAQERASAVDLSIGVSGLGASVSSETSSSGGSSGLMGWLQDRWNGARDGAAQAVDWVADRGADVWNGVVAAGNWTKDRIVDGWNWTKDRVVDAWNWTVDRTEAIVDDWANVFDAAGQFANATFGALFRGELPRTTEVLASALRLGGAALGAIATTETLGIIEANSFDDGEPWAGDPHKAPGEPPQLSDLSSVVNEPNLAGRDGQGQIRITTIDTPEGPRVIVAVPGTEKPLGDPIAGGNPMDATGNLVTAGGGRSTMTQAVELAMAKANIPPGAQVMLVGHSQGGMTVADLASDPGFVSRYHVTNAVTFGSPIDSDHIDPRVNVLELQHQDDLIPRLDTGDSRMLGPIVVPGNPSQSGPRHSTVTMPDPSSTLNFGGNHDGGAYAHSVKVSQDPALLAYQEELRKSGYIGGRTTGVVDIPVGRKDR
jgi:hypothetical protein